jgi:hypothetical protein
MELTAAIAQHLLEVQEGGNWTEVDLAHTLKDVTRAEATTLTAASPNTIAALLHHLTFWNRVMARRIEGLPTEIGPANGFDNPVLNTEADWKKLQADNIESAHELAVAIRRVEAAALTTPILPNYSSTYKNLQGTVEHVHYHLGQIVLLKNLIRNQQVHAS